MQPAVDADLPAQLLFLVADVFQMVQNAVHRRGQQPSERRKKIGGTARVGQIGVAGFGIAEVRA